MARSAEEQVEEAVQVRRLTHEVGAWKVLRDLRLDALKESPDAFSGQEEPNWPDERWRKESASGVWFVGRSDNRPAGIVRVVDYPGESPRWHVEGLWVSPDFRGRGLAQLLVRRAEVFVTSQGQSQLGLWVFDSNVRAANFYTRLGYAATERRGMIDGRPESEFAKMLGGPVDSPKT